MWKSIWSSQGIFSQGCRWHIGDGNSINIWQDAWLKNDDGLKLTTPIIEGLENLQVYELFIPGSHEWDIELLEELFYPKDVVAIANKSPSPHVGRDQLICHFAKDGVHSIKSGY